MRVLGIDLGSREVKIAVMEKGQLKYTRKISTMKFYRDYCYFDSKVTVDLNKLDLKDIDTAVSTGYGRNNTDLSCFTPINELKAHLYGAIYQTGLKDFTLLDIGGQDVKVVRCEKGIMTDLELNEKCAASCGRYLENMCSVLEIEMDELSSYYKNPVALNSTCAVFAESELIGKIATGVSIDRLCSGVNYSLYNKLRPMLTGFKGDTLLISGGVGKNKAIKRYLEKDYNNVIVLENPQLNGAIGCCRFGEITCSV